MAGSSVLTYENSHHSGLYPNEPWAANLCRVRNFLILITVAKWQPCWHNGIGQPGDKSLLQWRFLRPAAFLGGKPFSLQSFHPQRGSEQCEALQPFFLQLFLGTQITFKDSRPAWENNRARKHSNQCRGNRAQKKVKSWGRCLYRELPGFSQTDSSKCKV